MELITNNLELIEAAILILFILYPSTPKWIKGLLDKIPVAGGMFKALGGNDQPPKDKP